MKKYNKNVRLVIGKIFIGIGLDLVYGV